jgi:hypothetical protein
MMEVHEMEAFAAETGLTGRDARVAFAETMLFAARWERRALLHVIHDPWRTDGERQAARRALYCDVPGLVTAGEVALDG